MAAERDLTLLWTELTQATGPMSPRYSIGRFSDLARIDELHNLVVGAFGSLSIEPPSSVLKESAADFLIRLRSETALVAKADGALVGSLFCAEEKGSLYVGRLAV